MAIDPLAPAHLSACLAAMALAAPLVVALLLYDARWIGLSWRAGQRPPWGTWVRIGAALLCHGGAWLLATQGPHWPAARTIWWMHMLLDPGLSLYALGLWELARRVLSAPEVSARAR